MIGTQYKIAKKSDPTVFFTFNDHTTDNVIALQKYPSMNVDVRNDEINREGQHGVWDFYSFYGKRNIIFEGVIVGDTEVEVDTMKELMKTVTQLPLQPTTEDDGTLIVSWTDLQGRDLQLEAKIDTSIRFDRGLKLTYRLDFLLVLKSADPRIESQELFECDGIRGYGIGGFKLTDTSLKLPFSLVNYNQNIVECENIGSINANTIIKIYGSSAFGNENPRITNLTIGSYFEIMTTLTDETKWIEIDSLEGTVLDQDGVDQSGLISAGSEFITLAPGVNEILYTSDQSIEEDGPVATRENPTETIEVRHRFSIL